MLLDHWKQKENERLFSTETHVFRLMDLINEMKISRPICDWKMESKLCKAVIYISNDNLPSMSSFSSAAIMLVMFLNALKCKSKTFIAILYYQTRYEFLVYDGYNPKSIRHGSLTTNDTQTTLCLPQRKEWISTMEERQASGLWYNIRRKHIIHSRRISLFISALV